MRVHLCVASCLLVVAVCFAQPLGGLPPASADNSPAAIAAQSAELDKKEVRLGLEERRLALEHRERELALQRKMLDVQFGQRMNAMNQGAGSQWKQKIRRFLPLFILLKLAAGCAFLCCIVNILLTILVFTDMRARKEMNGLWIPLVLIGGVCTALIYALLRKGEAGKVIGDR